MASSKKRAKFRVATSGKAIDGRTIKPEWLTSMAKNYSTETRPAYVFNEHIRGYSGKDGLFPNLGKVLTLETREEDLKFGDKTEKRTTLWAEIEANDALLDFTSKGQKLHTSIEPWPGFNGNENEFYLRGLGATDDPASFHTSAMQFNANYAANVYLSDEPTIFEFTAEENEQIADNLFTAFMKKLQTAFNANEAPPKFDANASPANASNLGSAPSIQSIINDGFSAANLAFAALTKEIADLKSQISSANSQIYKTDTALTALKTEIDNSPINQFTPRPKTSGDDTALLADY